MDRHLDPISADAGIGDRFSEPDTLGCPWDYYRRLQVEAPIYFSATLDAFVVTKASYVNEVVRNTAIFSNRPQQDSTMVLWNFVEEFWPIYEELGTPHPVPTLVSDDGMSHARQRALLDPHFSAGAVRSYQDKILSVIDELIDGFIDRGEVDLYEEFCTKLPLFLLCDLLGISRAGIDILQHGADANVRLFGGALETPESRRKLARMQADLHLLFQPYLDKYRAAPEDNLISHMVHAVDAEGKPFSDQEILSMLTILNVGGNETTTNGLGNMFYLCFSDPAMQAMLRAETSEIPRFVEEALRLQPPVAIMPRWATQDTQLGGVDIPSGACLQLAFAAGNRDEQVIGCPADVDTRRKGIKNHLSFGTGIHYCLGAQLARLELKLAMERLFERMPSVRLAAADGEIGWQYKLAVRALTKLPIQFTRAPAS